jgi:hypothetical protein
MAERPRRRRATLGPSRAGRAGARSLTDICELGAPARRASRRRFLHFSGRGLRQLSNSTSSRSSPRVPPRAAPGPLAPARSTYVFTTGIGPTLGDITADYVGEGVRCADRHRSARSPSCTGDDQRRDDLGDLRNDAHPPLPRAHCFAEAEAPLAGEGTMVCPRTRMGEGSLRQYPSPIIARGKNRRPLPQGERANSSI